MNHTDNWEKEKQILRNLHMKEKDCECCENAKDALELYDDMKLYFRTELQTIHKEIGEIEEWEETYCERDEKLFQIIKKQAQDIIKKRYPNRE